MRSSLYAMFYEWGGINDLIFNFVNSIKAGPDYELVMKLLLMLSHSSTLLTYLFAMTFYALSMAYFRPILRLPGSPWAYVKHWVAVAVVLLVSLVLMHFLVIWLQQYFAMPRPFLKLPAGTAKALPIMPETQYYASFPSMHAAYATLWLAAMWPALWPLGRIILWAWVMGVAWACMAQGVNYPVDVSAGILISFLLVLLVRAGVYRIFGYR